MAPRTRTRSALLYVLTGIIGLALAYFVVAFFIIPDEDGSANSTQSANLNPSKADSLLPVNPAPSVDEILPEVTGQPVAEPPTSVVPVIIPNLVGKDLWDAQRLLDESQLVTIIRYDTSSFELPNTVVRQSPMAGQRMFRNDTVFVTISQFP